MEKEVFFSGYCRTIDDSRMVAVVADGSQLLEVDCCYENCIYTPNCIIAQKIKELLEQ